MQKYLNYLGVGLVLAIAWAGVAAAQSDARHIIEPIIVGLVFITFFSGLFVYLILRQAYQRKVYTAAIERGVPVPLPRKSERDPRQPALVLIALGLGFFIAVFVTLGLASDPHAPPALAVSIWGIIPILIGAALWVYQRMRAKELRQTPGAASETA